MAAALDETRAARPNYEVESDPNAGETAEPAAEAQDEFSDPEDVRPGTLAGAYRIEKMIGYGGGGTVYAAEHMMIGRKAAVKVLRREMASDPEMVVRFLREAQAVNMIKHPAIVDIFEFGMLPDQRPFYVMELLSGTDLRSILRQRGRFTPEEVLPILEPVCEALQCAHDVGIVHRDLKASNINVAFEPGNAVPVVKLLDFGIAKLLHPEPGAQGLTVQGTQLGTSNTMAPEQIRCQAIDKRTDVYALGVMLHQLLTGEYPFRSESRQEVQRMHLDTPAPRPSLLAPVPPSVDALVLKCMEKKPDNRFDSVATFLAAFKEAVRGSRSKREDAEPTSAVGIYVEGRIAEDGDDSDDDLLDDMVNVLDTASRILQDAGYALAIETGSAILGVKAIAEDARSAGAKSAAETAREIATELGGRDDAHEAVHVNVCVHLDDALGRKTDAGLQIVGGKLVDIGTWVPQKDADEVYLTPQARALVEI